LIERHRERVVQDKGESLGGSECVEHHEQCETDRVRQQRLVLGVDPVPC
jgi:hypothetical protein